MGTPPFFANLYLNEFDQFVKHKLRIKYYIRYTDDFVIVHHNKQYLTEVEDKIAEYLQGSLKLELHPNKVFVKKYHQGIDFLGYIELPGARLIRTKTKRRVLKKIAITSHKLQSWFSVS